MIDRTTIALVYRWLGRWLHVLGSALELAADRLDPPPILPALPPLCPCGCGLSATDPRTWTKGPTSPP